MNQEKRNKLIDIATLYYLEDKSQREIAAHYGISRPLISRYLKEAKEQGIVQIEIKKPKDFSDQTFDALNKQFGIQGGRVIVRQENDDATNKALASQGLDYLRELKEKRYGLGWGTIIGYVIAQLEAEEKQASLAGYVCPLLGNSEVSSRNYHSNELIRIFAEKTGAIPTYLHAPIFVETPQELQQLKKLESYRNISLSWKRLDVALVNIGNYPATPDFASNIRYGRRLIEEKAVGRMLGYFFNGEGKVLYSEEDYAVQIPLQLLKKTKHVVGICSANTKPQVIMGALHTGILDHIIAPQDILEEGLLL